MRNALILLGLLLFPFVVTPGWAEEIPDSLLAADYEQCVASAQKNKNLTAAQIDTYCSCVKDELKRRYDLRSYTELSVELVGGGLSEQNKKIMSELVYVCSQTLK